MMMIEMIYMDGWHVRRNMKYFYKTTNEKGHYHIVYFNEETLIGICSTAKGHQHKVFPNPNFIQDEGIINEEDPLIIENNSDHFHTTKNFNETKDTGLSEDEVISELKEIGDELKGYERESRDRAKTNIDFERGKQWDEKTKSLLNSKNRASLTINEIRPKINILTGYQAQNRSDIILRPIESGDQITADILTHVLKNVLENNNYFFTETKMFRKSAVAGRAILSSYIDFDDNIHGNIILKEIPYDSVWYSPHSDVTLEDCEMEYREQYLSISRARKMFPNISEYIEKETTGGKSKVGEITTQKRGYNDGDIKTGLDKISGKRIKIVELWRRTYERADIVINTKEEFFFNAGELTKLDKKYIKEFEDFRIMPRVSNKMRVTKMLGEKLLSDEILEDEMNFFQTFPLYCYKHDDGWDSIVTDAIDPQREVNKRHSQLVDILNRHASYGWIIDDQTFTKKEEKRFIESSGTAGFIAKTKQGGSLQKIDGTKFPNEVANLSQISSMKIKEVMNVNLEMQGMNSRAESGIAIIEKKKQGLIGNNFLFDNLSLLKKNITKYIIRLIQKYYSVERMLRILDSKSNSEELQLNGKEYKEYDRNDIKIVLENLDVTKYDVAISESNYSDTLRRADFAAWLGFASTSQVPPEFLIELSDLPKKEKMIAMFNRMQQQQQQEQQLKQQAEVEKTMIAQQNKQQ